MTTSTVPAAEVYATWRNYAGHTVVEYVDHTITVDGIVAPANNAPIWSEYDRIVSTARVDGVAREVPLWAVLDSRGNTDSEACLATCVACKDVWPGELLDGEWLDCPLCVAATRHAELAASAAWLDTTDAMDVSALADLRH